MSFSFYVPTRVEFGNDVVKNLPLELEGLGAKKVLLVTDPGIVKIGLASEIETLMKDARYEVKVFSEIEANPRDVGCDKGGEVAREFGADSIVALGGGSPMDTAKAISLLVTNPGIVNDYFGYDMMENPGIPLITIPTTAGTGSEVTIWAVITNTKKEPHAKDAIGSNMICPRVALIDPKLTYGLPPTITASTGMDALCHAYEAYTSNLATPYTDMYAERTIEIIGKYLVPAYAYGVNAEAREKMMLGQLFAGVSFSMSDVHINHALAEACGGVYDIAHGVANAIFLPFCMEFMSIADLGKHRKVAELLGRSTEGLNDYKAATEAVDAVFELRRALNIPALKEVGVKEKDFDDIVKLAMANLGAQDGIRVMTSQHFMDILVKTYRE